MIHLINKKTERIITKLENQKKKEKETTFKMIRNQKIIFIWLYNLHFLILIYKQHQQHHRLKSSLKFIILSSKCRINSSSRCSFSRPISVGATGISRRLYSRHSSGILWIWTQTRTLIMGQWCRKDIHRRYLICLEWINNGVCLD